MHKKMREYKLVRCNEKQFKKTRRIGGRCVLAGLLSLVLVVTAVPAFVFPRQSTVVAADEALTDISCGGIPAGDVTGNEIGSDCSKPVVSAGDMSTSDGMDVGAINNQEIRRTLLENVLTKELCREDILVALDAGHGGEDEGSSRAGVLEKTVNMQIVQEVEAQLEAMGYQVLLVREEDEELLLEERVQIANEARADIYVSIHQNACEEKVSAVTGVEVWYNAEKAEDGSKRLAQLIHSDLVLYTQAKDRGIVEDESLVVIRETDMPACLVETGFLSNAAERELLVKTEYQQRIAEGIVSGIDLYFFPKAMYLTFDDGPSAENTDKVLDILKERNVKATFFLIGENVEKHPEVAKRIVEEGHTIGIHCYNHDYDKLYQSVDSYVADFEKARTVIYEVTGVETKLFRFPGGSINSYNKGVYKEIVEEMTDRGYIYFDWNASLEDATRNNEPERLLQNAKESTFGRRRIVMLAHDVVYNTTLCLEDLLEQFPEYRMMPLTEDVEPMHF